MSALGSIEKGVVPGCNQRYCRLDVVNAFNTYYAELATGNPDFPLPSARLRLIFNKTRAGILLATGIESVDPKLAIPRNYIGDGSFETTFPIEKKYSLLNLLKERVSL